MSIENTAGAQNQNMTASLFPVTLREEAHPTDIGVTTSELDALESDRAEDIKNFTDDAIIQVKAKDLGKRYLHSRDANTLFVNLDDLRIYKGFNPRLPSAEWDAHITKLAKSIAENGFWEYKPLLTFAAKNGKNNVLFIADGESRYRAALMARDEMGADIESIPVRMAPENMSIEEIIMQLAPANEARAFTPLEKGLLAQRMISYRKSVSEIAANFKCSTEYVNQLLLLASAPSKVRQMVSDGAVPAALAIEVLRGPEPEKAVQNLQQAVANAKAQGKTKATAQHMPEYAQKRAVSSNSGGLHQIVQKLHSSEQFLLLDEETRNEINALLDKIQEDAKPKEPKKKAEGKKGKKGKGEAANGEGAGEGEGGTEGDETPQDDKQASLLDGTGTGTGTGDDDKAADATPGDEQPSDTNPAAGAESSAANDDSKRQEEEETVE